MKLPALFWVLALAVIGCSSLENTTSRPNPSGLYVEEDEDDFIRTIGIEEFELFPDGTAINRWKLSATSPAIKVLKEMQRPLISTREGRRKFYNHETKGTWRFRGDKIVYQKSETRIDRVGDFFLATFNPKEFRSGLSSQHVFTIDSNGDLLRIPPRGHSYYAGRFVKKK